jgi:hypothetical protein
MSRRQCDGTFPASFILAKAEKMEEFFWSIMKIFRYVMGFTTRIGK